VTDRLSPGQRLRSELVKALNADGRPMVQIAADAGLAVDTIFAVRKGRGLPLHQTVLAICEEVGADHIVAMSIEMREKPCAICGSRFVDMSRRLNRTYCTTRCLTLRRQRLLRDNRAREAMVGRNRLEMYQAAVVAYCHGCEPQGICRDGECSLRPVSPLTFIPMSRVRVA
jgi:hypothetical protein